MSLKIKQMMLLIVLMCLALVSCEAPDSCDLQMVAGGSKICQEARGK